ncbi:MAG: hypothetical protein VCG02_08010 [Verrucomicrobiota bacterium]
MCKRSTGRQQPGELDRDAPHLFGLGLQEMLADEMTTELRNLRDDMGHACFRLHQE